MFRVTQNVLGLTRRNQLALTSAQWSHLAPLSVATSQSHFHRLPGSSCIVSTQSYEKTKRHFLMVQPGQDACRSLHTSPKLGMQDELEKKFKLMLKEVDWKEVKNSPQPALVYGAAGLIPFVFPPLAILLNGAFLPNIAFAQLAYGATILSFLGGVKWGFSVPERSPQNLSWENLGTSVTMSLIGWGSLLLPPWIGTLTLVGGLGAAAYIDIMTPGYPQWFKAMRLCLSAVSIGSILVMLLLRILF